MLSGVGATAGTALSGQVDGTATTEVDQAIVLDGDDAVNSTAANSLTTVSADGTQFRVASQVFQGETYDLELILRNRANVDLDGELLLELEGPLQISAAGGEFTQVQRVDSDRFILAVSSLANGTDGDTDPDTVTLTVAVPNDAEPGFYDISGTIVTGTRSSADFDETVGGTVTFSGESTESPVDSFETTGSNTATIDINNGADDNIHLAIEITDRSSNPISDVSTDFSKSTVSGSFDTDHPVSTDDDGIAENRYRPSIDKNGETFTISAEVPSLGVTLKVEVTQGSP